MSSDEILSFMDLLDLDEEVIDSRLQTIMVRSNYSSKNLKNALQLLQYKQMINLQENTECENDNESDFLAKIIKKMHEGNIDIICKITYIVLSLNKSKIVSKSEHLLQQILSNIVSSSTDAAEDVKPSKTLLNLKLCDSILDAAIENGLKLSLLFLHTPLENILSSSDEKLKVQFLTNTVPRLFEGVTGYNILDQIWNYLKQINENENALKILSCLSEFYLPVTDEKGNLKLASVVVFDYEFWYILFSGLQSNDPSNRKVSVYLIKRAIDCSIASKKDVHAKSEKETLFVWEQKTEKEYKQMWNNYFILIDSLEEKQSNIVLPSLKLFDILKDMQNCWLKCAFNIALRHDNKQVKLKCIEYRLQFEISSEEEADMLLEALNDINLYDCIKKYKLLNEKFTETMKDTKNFKYIFKSISKVKWSPVPLYHLSKVLASIKNTSVMENSELSQTVIEILKVPCNNIAIRKAVHINMSYFIGNCCKNLQWREIINIYSSFEFDTFSPVNENSDEFKALVYKLCLKLTSTNDDNELDDDDNPFISLITGLWSNLNASENEHLLNVITDDHTNIDFGLYYLKSLDGLGDFLNCLSKKFEKIKNIINRQYSDKTECLNDVIYFIQLYHKTCKKYLSQAKTTVHTIISTEYNTIIKYVLSLLSNETDINVEGIISLFKRFPSISSLSAVIDDTEAREIQLQLYKSSILLLEDSITELQKKVISIFIANIVTNDLKDTQYRNEMLNLNQMLNVLSKTEFCQGQNKESNGRLRNVFFEKSCEFVYHSLKQSETEIKSNLKELLEFIENVTECGGYGCLKWILKIMNEIVPQLLSDESVTLNMIQFIDRMWKEIEELKSNNQYTPCIEEFVNLITHEALLEKSMYNNIIIYYCNKIMEYGPMKNAPLFYLITTLNSKDNITTDHGQLIYILSEILLYSPVPRKDQRITENVEVEILHDPKYGLNHTENAIHFNYQIKHLSVSTLCKINNPEILNSIVSVIISKIDNAFRNKQRYHGNSQPHRLLLTGLQHILTIGLLSLETVYNEKMLSWIIELMGKLPHQASVRICLEWYIALYLYVKHVKLDKNIEILKCSKIPITSLFVILYWVLKKKITNGSCKAEEYDFVMDKLMSHTMGQAFNVRLNAQYLATQLYQIKSTDKYSYTIGIIENTFKDGAKDKNFIKLKDEFFANNFDIVRHLTPCFVYYFMPRYFDIGANEFVDMSYIRKASKEINMLLENVDNNIYDFKKEWMVHQASDEDVLSYNVNRNAENDAAVESGDSSGTIQKKYIPWKNMSRDIEVYDTGKKRESSSELIVVASLIDKLPNLGGMARTSEVFGVKTYVVDSLRHLQDKQFQGLSVSAERWVDIEEVRPGRPLKDYLTRMKAQGYYVVAAEQTSTSCKLQGFQFPEKTLLLLGHEKEGIPCDLLPLMDQCVEIPQQGFVRSLNVHVTASIFIWEYVRQNLL